MPDISRRNSNTCTKITLFFSFDNENGSAVTLFYQYDNHRADFIILAPFPLFCPLTCLILTLFCGY
ncbi:hypothetical protein AYY16_12290 [Morganella psychrotolerans]|nr:hypothetical protein AYY16_12290 [Morganella psychrotolerans]